MASADPGKRAEQPDMHREPASARLKAKGTYQAEVRAVGVIVATTIGDHAHREMAVASPLHEINCLGGRASPHANNRLPRPSARHLGWSRA